MGAGADAFIERTEIIRVASTGRSTLPYSAHNLVAVPVLIDPVRSKRSPCSATINAGIGPLLFH